MGKTLKLNFTVPEDVASELRDRVVKSKRSAFVTEALRAHLQQIAKAKLQQDLIEGYRARYVEDAGIDREWQTATLENVNKEEQD
jgi:hypothetical protein